MNARQMRRNYGKLREWAEEAEGCQSGQRQVMHCMEMTHIMFMIHSSIINFSRTLNFNYVQSMVLGFQFGWVEGVGVGRRNTKRILSLPLEAPATAKEERHEYIQK